MNSGLARKRLVEIGKKLRQHVDAGGAPLGRIDRGGIVCLLTYLRLGLGFAEPTAEDVAEHRRVVFVFRLVGGT